MYYPTPMDYFQIHYDGTWSMFKNKNTEIVITSNVDALDSMYGGSLMQFVGFKDKQGKDIYYGDIIKYTITWDEEQGDINERGTAIIIRGMNYGVGIQRSYEKRIELDKATNQHYMPTYADYLGEGMDIWEDEDIFDIEVLGNVYENEIFINH
jgi:hypothetical protein